MNACFFFLVYCQICALNTVDRAIRCFFLCFVFVWSENRDEGREEGIVEILPLVFSRTLSARLRVRASATELALFHTGAILSSLGCHSPATATWEHLGGDRCLFGVCVEALVCAELLFQTIPLQPTSSPTPRPPVVHRLCLRLSNQWEIHRQIFSSIFVFFNQLFFCSLA